MQDRQSRLLPLIAAFKIAKACLLFAVAFGWHKLANGDVQKILEAWMHIVRVDPDGTLAKDVISKLTGLPPHRLHELGVGTFFYGLMFGIEGTGLLLKQRWAEYMTVITTTTFLPLEIFELFFRPERKVEKAVLLLINTAILAYLAWNLVRDRRIHLRQAATGTT